MKRRSAIFLLQGSNPLLPPPLCPLSRLRRLGTNRCSELPASLGEAFQAEATRFSDSLSLPEIAFAFF